MSARDRTLPAVDPQFVGGPRPHNLHSNFRFIVDVSAILSIAGLLIGGGMAWQRFLDDSKRLDQHDQLITELTSIEQQQQVTMATIAQTVKDLQDSRRPEDQ